MSANIPQYELLADHFFEPEMVGKGSVIEYDGTPNNMMKPLNEEAEEALERWYSEEFPVLDDKTGKPTKHLVDGELVTQTHQPRHELRPIEQRNPGSRPGIRVVSVPDLQKVAVENQLAAVQHGPAKEWTRPEPDSKTGVKVVKAEPALAGNTTKASA